jgi:hypothetical protein
LNVHDLRASSFCSVYIKGIISQLIDLYNGQTNFDLRLITLDLSTQKLLFTDVLSPQYSIVIKILIFYMNKGNVPLFISSMKELQANVAYYIFKSYHWVMSPCIDIMNQLTIRPGYLSVKVFGSTNMIVCMSSELIQNNHTYLWYYAFKILSLSSFKKYNFFLVIFKSSDNILKKKGPIDNILYM